MYKKMTKAERRIRLIGVKIGILEDVRLSFGLPCFIFGLIWFGFGGGIGTDASVGDGTGSSELTS